MGEQQLAKSWRGGEETPKGVSPLSFCCLKLPPIVVVVVVEEMDHQEILKGSHEPTQSAESTQDIYSGRKTDDTRALLYECECVSVLYLFQLDWDSGVGGTSQILRGRERWYCSATAVSQACQRWDNKSVSVQKMGVK